MSRTDNNYQPPSTDVWLGAENYFIQATIEEAVREARIIKKEN